MSATDTTPPQLPLASRQAAILLRMREAVDHFKATGELPGQRDDNVNRRP